MRFQFFNFCTKIDNMHAWASFTAIACNYNFICSVFQTQLENDIR